MIAINLAIKNVYRKRERSFLTIIGVLLAVGSFISLLSIAEGLYERVSREVYGRLVDIYIMPGDAASLPTGPVGTVGFSSEVLKKEMVKDLDNIQEIQMICPIYRIQQKMGGQTIIIWGIDSDKFRHFFPFFQLQPGSRMFVDSSFEIVVGGALARLKSIRMESPVVVEGQPFNTVGIGNSIGGFQDYFCFISLENAMKLKSSKGYQEIWLQLRGRSKSNRDNFAISLRKLFPHLSIKTREEYLGSARDYVSYAWLLQFAISAIGVLIAMTASMNTMLMSTYERIKEFGTLRSIGASRFTVFSMILMESLILTMVGGMGGIVLGIMGSKVLDEAMKALLQLSFPMANITLQLVVYALILSVVIGVVGAIIPTIIVYRMSVIDALRWE